MPLISTVMKPNETAASKRGVFAKAQFEIPRHRVRLGDVIKRHHHNRQEQHGGNRADPIPVRRQNAVLIGRAGPAHQFKRAQIGGHKA